LPHKNETLYLVRTKICIIFLFFGFLIIHTPARAQEKEIEEESAAISLEDYTDEFQENFFEALKQKGIENYDKAINLLLECKLLDANNVVVDHELAKVYLADRKYIQAQEYGILALISEPENLWYLNTLVEIIQKQGNTLDILKDRIPYDNSKLKENLARIYFRKKNFQSALKILEGIKKSSFSEGLLLKIKDSLEQDNRRIQKPQNQVTVINDSNPLEHFRSQVSELIQKNDFSALGKVSLEAMENFPSQPYFYYANGLALNKTAKHEQALRILESGLDYLLDDADLANKMYKELAIACSALGNTSKANMYLSRIKSGS